MPPLDANDLNHGRKRSQKRRLHLPRHILRRPRRQQTPSTRIIRRAKRPPAPKATTYPPQDQVGHWYEAQLLHYGLARTKDKNAAKVRLTTAITAGTLAVPAYILQMEAEMKKDYAAAGRRTKAAATRLGMASGGSIADSRKRKADNIDDRPVAGSRTNVSVKIGNTTLNIDHQESAVGDLKKRRVIPSSSNTRSSPLTPSARRQTARPGRIPSIRGATPTPTPSRNREHERFNSHYQHNNIVDLNDSSPPPYDSLNFASGISHVEDHTRIVLQASGRYRLDSDYDDDSRQFSLIKDKATGEFLGRFRAAGHEGVLHIADPDGMTEKQRVSFTWRAEDLGTGQLRFRRDQDGWIWFDGRGGIRGCWNRLLYNEDVEFEGELHGEPDVGVQELVEQWDGFIRAAYGRY